jgi:hypothetical protein
MAHSSKPPDDEAGKDALDAALDWTKGSTAVATGALVFGVGLLNGSATYSRSIRDCLMGAWVALGLAILSGIVAQSAIPPMIRAKNYDLEYRPFTYPARIHQLSWLAGIAFLAIALGHILFGTPPLDSLKVTSAQQAVTAALPSLPGGRKIQKMAVVELIKGADPSDSSLTRWHVQFLLASATDKNTQDSVDVMIDPVSGAAMTVGGPK